MYPKRGGVAAYHIVWIGLCLRSVPGVRVLASAVDTALARTCKSSLFAEIMFSYTTNILHIHAQPFCG